MENSNSATIEQVFKIVDCWRHLPAYRLEPRVAPFFALFLREVLSKKFETELHEMVIPEFPLRIGTLQKSGKTGTEMQKCPGKVGENQSYNVDYVAFSSDFTKTFLVELKTDIDSVSAKQQCYLRKAAEVGIDNLIDGLIEICKKTEKRTKYVHLLHRLAKIGFISIPNETELYDLTFPQPRRGWSAALEKVKFEPRTNEPKCQVVYIQPTRRDTVKCFDYIYFDEVADSIQEISELGRIFAGYLRQWTAPAGGRDPREITQIV